MGLFGLVLAQTKDQIYKMPRRFKSTYFECYVVWDVRVELRTPMCHLDFLPLSCTSVLFILKPRTGHVAQAGFQFTM